jgi:hypothetical protein
MYKQGDVFPIKSHETDRRCVSWQTSDAISGAIAKRATDSPDFRLPSRRPGFVRVSDTKYNTAGSFLAISCSTLRDSRILVESLRKEKTRREGGGKVRPGEPPQLGILTSGPESQLLLISVGATLVFALIVAAFSRRDLKGWVHMYTRRRPPAATGSK